MTNLSQNHSSELFSGLDEPTTRQVTSMTNTDPRTDQVLLGIDGGIATITFSNPAKRNALSFAMRRALVTILQELRDDPAVRVVVLTGDGDDAFVSGADLSEVAMIHTAEELQEEGRLFESELGAAWDELHKPVIAMIQGFCIGAGLLMALDADIRVAGEGSQFGIPAARLGLGYSLVEPLAAVVGTSWAAEMLYSGRRVSAAEALQIGLVNHVVPKADLRTFTMDLAGEIAGNAPLTVATMRFALRQLRLEPSERDDAGVEAMAQACLSSEDFKEGQAAFRERRPPQFTGR